MNKPTKFTELQQKLLSDMFKQQFDKMTINNFIFKVCYDNDKIGAANLHYHKVINRLSRKIQKRNNEIKHLDKLIGANNYSFHCLYKEKSALESRINKVLEYIGEPNDFLNSEEMKYIKEILKGDSNEPK